MSANRAPWSPLDNEDEVETPDTAGHFVELIYQRGGLLRDVDSTGQGGIQGAIAVSCAANAIRYPRVFAADFQRRFDDLGELRHVRRDGHSFRAARERTPTSYRVSGRLAKTSEEFVPGFVAMEAFVDGVAAVYFWEDTDACTLDELVAWWVVGALNVAADALYWLGVLGPASASVLVDTTNLLPRPADDSHWATQFKTEFLNLELGFPRARDRYLWGETLAWEIAEQVREQLLHDLEMKDRASGSIVSKSVGKRDWLYLLRNEMNGGRRRPSTTEAAGAAFVGQPLLAEKPRRRLRRRV